MARPDFGCGREECCASGGICDRMTFGTGRLDWNGYWEHPCAACARAYEAAHPEGGLCWPAAEDAEEEVTNAEG